MGFTLKRPLTTLMSLDLRRERRDSISESQTSENSLDEGSEWGGWRCENDLETICRIMQSELRIVRKRGVGTVSQSWDRQWCHSLKGPNREGKAGREPGAGELTPAGSAAQVGVPGQHQAEVKEPRGTSMEMAIEALGK